MEFLVYLWKHSIGTSGYVEFTGLPVRGMHKLKVFAMTKEGQTASIKRQFSIGLLWY